MEYVVDELAALDAGFLELEDAHVAIHIGAAAVFEGPPPSTAELVARYEHVVFAHPRYRQVLVRAPLDLRRPRWQDAGQVDLNYHLRRAALPAPGTHRQFEDLIGRIMSARLDPERPLWEVWVVEGLADDRWAVVTKMHHSTADGVSAMATLLDLLDPVQGGAELAVLPVTSAPDGVASLLTGAWQRLADLGRHPVGASRSLLRSAASVPRTASVLRLAAHSSLNGPLTRDRYYRTLTVERADVDAVRQSFGGTVNDVVLTLVSRGFHQLLLARGEQPVSGAVRSMVPMNLRRSADLRVETNKVTFVIVDLPTACDASLDAYRAVRARTAEAKRSSVGGLIAAAFAVANLVPSPFVSATLKAFRRIPQRIITTITTNVPGPRGARSLFGRRLVALYPYVPIADRIRIAVAVTSCGGELHFGVTCDRAAVATPDVFVDAMAEALRELVKDARSIGPAPR